MATAEERLKDELDELMRFLLRSEPSLATSASATLTKALVLAGASEIEVDVQQHIVDYYVEISGEDAAHAAAFVEKKAVKRQYHTYFDWDKPSANPFFALFGPVFSVRLKAQMKADEEFATSVRAFLQIGSLRNQIVHQNFAAFTLELTPDEVHAMCVSARLFVDRLPAILRDRYPEEE